MSALRQATRTHHDRVEAAVRLPARCRSLAAYGELLRDLESFHARVEPRLQGTAGLARVVGDLTHRVKLPWLRADLAAMGLQPRRDAPAVELDVRDADAALGCLYVLEGATLGGAQIARAVQSAHGVTAARGAAFFHSYGAERGARWRAFGAAVEARAEACGELPPATVTGARATFDAFQRHLTPTPRTEIAA